MAFPLSVARRTVRVAYTDFVTADGATTTAPVSGSVSLTCADLLRVPADDLFLGPFTLTGTFDPDTGVASIADVPVSDDPNLSATFDYHITVLLHGKHPQRFRARIEGTDPEPVNLADKPVTVAPIVGATYVTADGANILTAANEFRGPVTIRMSDLLTPALVIKQPNQVTDPSDTDVFQGKDWLGKVRAWLNEKFMGRFRRAGNEILLRLYADPQDGSTPTASIIEVLGMLDARIARLGAQGSFYHGLNDETAWSNIAINTGSGKFSAYTQDDNGGTFQCRVTKNGKRTEFRGRVEVANDTASNAMITLALPAGLIFLGMGGTVNAAPARRRQVTASPDSAGGQRVRVNKDGSVQLVGTLTVNTSLYFDGCYIDRE